MTIGNGLAIIFGFASIIMATAKDEIGGAVFFALLACACADG